MSCKDVVEGRVLHAQSIIVSFIKSGGNVKDLLKGIEDAIFDCPELGDDMDSKNDLMLKVAYHLRQYYGHAEEPAVGSLDEISSRPVPPRIPIIWDH